MNRDELRARFVEHIAPELDAWPRGNGQPVVVLVGGQPGAGKTQALSRLVRGSSPAPYPVIGDELRAYHPDYARLVEEDPLRMPEVTAAASAAWVSGSAGASGAGMPGGAARRRVTGRQGKMSATALQLLEDDVRELIRRRRLDPTRDDAAVHDLVGEVLDDYDDRSLVGGLVPITDRKEAHRALVESVAGFGPLQPYLDDPAVEEIWINEPTRVFVARNGRSELTPTLLSEQQVHDLVERMLRSSGRRVDLSSPFVDASLPDGSRLHVAIPDITRRHWAVNIRKFVVAADELADLVRLGTLSAQAARFLEAAVASGLNILVAGGTQAGNATTPKHTHQPQARCQATTWLLSLRKNRAAKQ